MTQYAWLVPIFPLLAFAIVIFFTYKNRFLSGIISILSMAASLVLSLFIMFDTVINHRTTEFAVRWLSIPSFGRYRGLDIDMGVLVDGLSGVMLFIVTFIAFLVTLYSFGYMKGDEGYSRYFAYISLFTFSMLGLVIANNYFQILVFWEFVGLCSYLLIGFWYHKPSAADASKKAFITNRWADFGFMVGVILLFVYFGTFNFGQLSTLIAGSRDYIFLTLVGILIFIGPIGKSAQFPLHVWLPDAMEGPTPISALIHAATMVAAGVYLTARGYILFASTHTVLTVIAYIGGFTAMFAATIAVVQYDIKRILAYSTLSQLGYMIMALGVGSMTAGMFHLTTHAFFKALLFLGAGSVIHALHEQNIFKMGGLRKKMPITTWTFVIGALALSGIFPLAGFWSKDEVFTAALYHGYIGLYILALLVGFITPFYMFRLIFTAFMGEKESEHARESSWVMTYPLILLSIFAVFSGFINSGWFYKISGYSFGQVVFFGEPEIPHLDISVAVISNIIALLGIAAAYFLYYKKTINTSKLADRFSGLYNVVHNGYYIDAVYSWLFSRVMIIISRTFDWIDHYVIDGIFDGLANVVRLTGRRIRVIQTGVLQNYALVIFSAVAIITVIVSTVVLGGGSR